MFGLLGLSVMSELDPNNRLWRHVSRTVDSLPSVVARLVYLASLRDAYTGRYLHEGWITMGEPEEVNTVLRQLHGELFNALLELELARLCSEIRGHFEGVGGSAEKLSALWLELEPYREMIPLERSAVERAFFISQMKAALGVLQRCPDLAPLLAPSA